MSAGGDPFALRGPILGITDEEGQAQARASARHDVERLVERLAGEVFGATRHERPVEGFRSFTRTELEPATDGIRAALLVRNLAESWVREHVEKARGAGSSWAEIAKALGVAEDASDPAAAAYAYVVWHEPFETDEPGHWARREAKAHWTCNTCGQRVTDTGPWGGHPEDNETGHAATCERFNGAVAAYMAEWEDE